VLLTIFRDNAKAAEDLWVIMATKIKTAADVELTPRAVPRKNEGIAIITVMIIGMEGGVNPSPVDLLVSFICFVMCSRPSKNKNAAITIMEAIG